MLKKSIADVPVNIKNLTDYLKGEVEVKRDNRYKYLKAISLSKVIEVFDNDCSLYEKIYQLNLIYKNSKEFSMAFSQFLGYEQDPFLGSFVKKWKDIYEVYKDCEEKGIVEEVKYLVKIQDYFQVYSYAKFLLDSYVKDSSSFDTASFLDRFGIDFSSFNYCVCAIETLDPELYHEYCLKAEENKEKRKEYILSKTDKLVNGIKTGIAEDGTPFTLVEFLKLLPFSDNDCVKQIINDFGGKNKNSYLLRLYEFFRNAYPNDCSLILDYMHKKKLTEDSFRPLNLNEIYKVKVSVDGRVITDEDNTQILSYMEENGIPMVSRAFIETRNQFLNNGLSNEKPKVKRFISKTKYTIVN